MLAVVQNLDFRCPALGYGMVFFKDHAFFTGYFCKISDEKCSSFITELHTILVLFKGGTSGEDRDNVGAQHGGMSSLHFYCFSKDIFYTSVHLLHKNFYEKSCLLLSS